MMALGGVILIIFLFLCPLTAGAQFVTYVYHICGIIGNYTSDSPYGKNLHSILSSITSHPDGLNGFYRSYEGAGEDTAYAYALCRGDISSSICSRCVMYAADDLLLRCPYQTRGQIWYENCMLVYGESYLYLPVGAPYFYTWNDQERVNQSHSDSYLAARQQLGASLIKKASSGNSSLKFAAGHTSYTDTENIYALVQCIPVLDESECSPCLEQALRESFRLFPNFVTGRILLLSCDFRISPTQFYENGAESTPLPPPPPPPPLPPSAVDAPGPLPYTINAPPPPSKLQFPPPSSSQTSRADPNVVVIVVIVSVSVICFLILSSVCITFIFLRLRRGRQKLLQYSKSSKQSTHGLFTSEDPDEIKNVESLQFDFRIVEAATDNFAIENKLGEGGFGSVYKGKLAEGREIAVKRLAVNSGQGEIEFKNEVLLVAKLQHKNLVRLLGFCLEGRERLLIYEFVPNTSLDLYIFDAVKSAHLDWATRYKIIAGVARGLLYLHEDSRLTIIHRDLKASNILLDEGMNPKIADFGMARLFSVNQTKGTTYRIAGTRGYMAPEYVVHGTFSVKSDVYSFGVLLLEIISGRRNSIIYRFGNAKTDLISYAWENWKKGTAPVMIDQSLVVTGPTNEILRCIHIGLLCVQAKETDRPTMASVTLMLSSQYHCLPFPSEPSSLVRSSLPTSEISTDSGESSGAKRLETGTCNITNEIVAETYVNDTSATLVESR